jgi:hypothetical protein
MRRLISISMALALVFSLVSPLLAEACMHSNGRATCHRASHGLSHRHCEGMEAGDEEMPAPAPGGSVTGVSQKCPMNCCLMAQTGKQTAVANPIFAVPQLAVSGKLRSVVIVFMATGYSSHTDRGPPAV